MTLDDLKNHTTTPVTPISISYGGENGVTLHETPPNGQGLTALIALGILEAMQDQGKVDLNKVEHLSAEWFHPLMYVPLSFFQSERGRAERTRLTSLPLLPLPLSPSRTARPSASPLPTLAPTSPTPSTRACPSTSSSRSRTSPSAQSCSTRSARRPSSTRGRRSRRPTRSCSRSWTSTGASSSCCIAVRSRTLTRRPCSPTSLTPSFSTSLPHFSIPPRPHLASPHLILHIK